VVHDEAPAALTFYGALARGELLPSGDTDRVLAAMRRVVPEQRWGLGALDLPIPFKGGWGSRRARMTSTRPSG
jgi:hypothetical protein